MPSVYIPRPTMQSMLAEITLSPDDVQFLEELRHTVRLGATLARGIAEQVAAEQAASLLPPAEVDSPELPAADSAPASDSDQTAPAPFHTPSDLLPRWSRVLQSLSHSLRKLFEVWCSLKLAAQCATEPVPEPNPSVELYPHIRALRDTLALSLGPDLAGDLYPEDYNY